MVWSSALQVLALTFVASAAPAPVAAPHALIPAFLSTVMESSEQLGLLLGEELEDKFEKDELDAQFALFQKNPELFKLHKKLVNIESISGNEVSVSNYLQNYLSQLGLGLELAIDETGKNIYAYGSENGSTKVLLTSHIDTVPPYIDYFVQETEDGDVEIHGRGSCDAKGSVAAQIIAAKELLEDGIVTTDDLSLLFVFAEEVGGAGMRSANSYLVEEGINWDAVIFGEPTENKLATGHKGIYLAKLEVFGVASHSGYPDMGIDADKIMIEIMHELETYNWPTSELLNSTTLNIGMFGGGIAGNVISPYAECTILMRTAVDADEIDTIVQSIVSKHESKAKDLKLDVRVTDDPVSLDYEVDGFETIIASYSTDIPNLKQRGFKRYLYGPGSILVAHGDHEYVTASSMLQAVEDYKKLVLYSLGK